MNVPVKNSMPLLEPRVKRINYLIDWFALELNAMWDLQRNQKLVPFIEFVVNTNEFAELVETIEELVGWALPKGQEYGPSFRNFHEELLDLSLVDEELVETLEEKELLNLLRSLSKRVRKMQIYFTPARITQSYLTDRGYIDARRDCLNGATPIGHSL